MSNDCIGVMKVVAKDKMTLERIKSIMNYEDDEYCPYRCKQFDECGEAYEEDGYWIQDFNIDGAWECGQFFNHGDCPDKHLQSFAKNPDGSTNFNETIYKTAHFTDLVHLARVLDFGCELYCCESGCEFCQHFLVNHNGELLNSDTKEYHIVYPKDKDGNIDYDGEPEEEFGIDNYMEFDWLDVIYGK